MDFQRYRCHGQILVLALCLLACSNYFGASEMSGPKAATRIRDEPESVWVEFIQLALDHKPLNLGQGFPDFAAPQYLVESLKNATDIHNPSLWPNHQYTRSFGHPRLVRAVTEYYRNYRGFHELKDPNEQVLITVGAYEALFASIMAFVDPGDEVIIIDPAFDAYAPIVALAQGRSIFVPLRDAHTNNNLSSSRYSIDMKELESKLSNRTKLMVLNTPNNPLGKIYSRQELKSIADLCVANDIIVIADEVYEHLYHQPNMHTSIASFPGMWNRTITIGSAGKTFSVTGWKIGWAFGPKELIRFAQLIHQTAIYTVATPIQEAVARAFEREMSLLRAGNTSYWSTLREDLVKKRDRMARILQKAGINPIVPEGGYFMLADFSPISNLFPDYQTEGQVTGRPNTNDFKFARWLAINKKLQTIPASAFYSPDNKHLAENLLRFCFIKQDSTLDRLEEIIDEITQSNKLSVARPLKAKL